MIYWVIILGSTNEQVMVKTTTNRLLQANLASVLAFIPSFIFFNFAPKNIVESYDLWREGLPLTFRQDLLLGGSIHCWLPALLIYLLMRMTQFDQWLKVSLLAHFSILIANLSFLYFVNLNLYYNKHMYFFNYQGEYIFFSNLTFAAIICILNIIWHYLNKNDPVKLFI